jgi:hypothetical protein
MTSSGSDFLTSYGSGSTSQKVTVPTVPVPQRLKKAGSKSVSASQWYGSVNSDSYQNVTDPQNWWQHYRYDSVKLLLFVCRYSFFGEALD